VCVCVCGIQKQAAGLHQHVLCVGAAVFFASVVIITDGVTACILYKVSVPGTHVTFLLVQSGIHYVYS